MTGSTAPARVAWHGGRFVPEAEAALPIGSLALRYGLSVFEGVRVYRGDDGGMAPWLLDLHLDRLDSSVALMRLGEPGGVGREQILDVVDGLVRRNQVATDAYCRIAVSAGGIGLLDAPVEPVLTVSVAPSGRKKWLGEGRSMRAHVSRWSRPAASAFPPAAKCVAAYAAPRLALLEARDLGCDTVILRSPGGAVCEAPTANVFAVVDGALVTPPVADGPLPGITRAWVLAAAESVTGRAAVVRSLAVDELASAAEVFLCGTAIEFGPVGSVDGAVPAAGAPGPVTAALVERYFDEVRGRRSPTAVRWSAGD